MTDESILTCKSCNTKISKDAKFCSYCGTEIKQLSGKETSNKSNLNDLDNISSGPIAQLREINPDSSVLKFLESDKFTKLLFEGEQIEGIVETFLKKQCAFIATTERLIIIEQTDSPTLNVLELIDYKDIIAFEYNSYSFDAIFSKKDQNKSYNLVVKYNRQNDIDFYNFVITKLPQLNKNPIGDESSISETIFCRNCGQKVDSQAPYCMSCGVRPLTANNYCPDCGMKTTPNQEICVSCKAKLSSVSATSNKMAGLISSDNNQSLVYIVSGIVIFILLVGYYFLSNQPRERAIAIVKQRINNGQTDYYGQELRNFQVESLGGGFYKVTYDVYGYGSYVNTETVNVDTR